MFLSFLRTGPDVLNSFDMFRPFELTMAISIKYLDFITDWTLDHLRQGAGPVWPSNLAAHSPVSTVQMRAVPSSQESTAVRSSRNNMCPYIFPTHGSNGNQGNPSLADKTWVSNGVTNHFLYRHIQSTVLGRREHGASAGCKIHIDHCIQMPYQGSQAPEIVGLLWAQNLQKIVRC